MRRIALAGLALLAAALAASARDSGYYTNSSGHRVHRPAHSNHGAEPQLSAGMAPTASATIIRARVHTTES